MTAPIRDDATRPAHRTLSLAAWRAEAVERFGANPLEWAFVCPACGYVAKAADWLACGASEGQVAFSCVGRYDPGGARDAFAGAGAGGGPCTYAGGGLIGLNPVRVLMDDGKERPTFEFADATLAGA